MAPTGQTIPAMAARDVTFTDHQVARPEPFYLIADRIDNSDELVADRHRHRYRFLSPRVPIVNVDISAADRRFHNANPDIIAAHFGHRDFLQPKPRLRLGFYHCFHRLLHQRKLGESRNEESRNSVGNGTSRQPGAEVWLDERQVAVIDG